MRTPVIEFESYGYEIIESSRGLVRDNEICLVVKSKGADPLSKIHPPLEPSRSPYKKPMYRGTTRVSEKCIACYPRIEGKDPLTGGEPMETRCMAACVGKIRMQSLMRIGEDGLWAEDRWHPLYYAIRVEQVALPLYPQWGTEPNGFYIPPRHSPRGYARQMFGPGVDNAIEKYLVPSRELLAVLQLWRASQQIVFRYDVIPGPKVFETQIHGKRFEMYNDTVLGFNKSGKEVARVQVEEPIYIRPAERVTWL